MSENVQGTFVSEKVSKVRWQHEDFTESKSFLTGSWDDAVRLLSDRILNLNSNILSLT